MDNNDENLKSSRKLQKMPVELLNNYFFSSFSNDTSQAMTKIHEKAQRLLPKIFYNFTNVVADEIDDLINLTLKEIGEFDGDDRCCIFLFSEDEAAIRKTYIWCKEDIDNSFNSIGI